LVQPCAHQWALDSLSQIPSKLQWLSPTLSNASRRNAPTSGLPAKKIPNASQLLRTARKNARPQPLAGASALLKKATAPPLTSPSVQARTDVSVSNHQLRLLLLPPLTLSNASRRNAPTSGLPAKKIPNASQLLRTARKNARPQPLAGASALLKKATAPPLTSPSVQARTDVLV
jgi:hypothetical protein